MKLRHLIKGLLTVIAAALSVALMASPLQTLLLGSGGQDTGALGAKVEAAISDRYDMYINNRVASALEGVLSVEKVYWLSDHDPVAPEPDQSKFGATADPAQMAGFLESAQDLLQGQQTLFQTDVKLMSGTKINYYLDETIMVITWKQVIHNAAYTFSEIKIAHPSQFRRFLAGGSYGSGIQLTTSDMAKSVNAVVASSGDFYAFRPLGVKVYEGVVRSAAGKYLDTCFIDAKGDLLFKLAGELTTVEKTQAFVDENNVRFSLAFGPVLLDHGKKMPINRLYAAGEVNNQYSRAALCQLGELHYLLVAANLEGTHRNTPTMHRLQETLADMGVPTAYALDGGQTAAIVMNDRLINRVDWGVQRKISDIIYFATAIPD